MSTQAQVDANRANAQLSTGPRSPEGKSSSSQNALKHGLSSQYVPLSESERPQFEALEADFRREVKPSGALQECVFQDLVAAAWKRSIVNRLLSQATANSESLFDDETSERVRKLERHRADQNRAFNKALRTLRELQTNDQLRAALPDAPEAPGLADYAKITKQTQNRSRLMADIHSQVREQVQIAASALLQYFQERLPLAA
ncbi:MAG: hypothetical protein U0R19_31125 [Bryobacteraceae bacterium]